MNFKFKTRKRRGLSSVVGALFFIVLMIAAFTALLAAFSYQNDLIDTQKSIADLQVAKVKENFVVTAAANNGGCTLVGATDKCLDVTVNNKGTNTVQVAKLWVIEKLDADGDANSYEADAYDTKSTLALNFNDLITPVGTSKKITTNLIPDNSADTDGYTIKVVSKLGTIVTVNLPETPGTPGPPGAPCWDLNGNNEKDLTFGPPGFIIIDGVTIYTEDSNGSGEVTVLDCKGATGSPGPTPAIDDDLLNKPGIFVTFPSPFGIVPGTSPSTGQWGAIIANPSEFDMIVNKIVFTTILTGAAAGETSFPSGCTVGVGWYCGNNQLIWEGSPVLIPTRSAHTFLTDIRPDNTIAKNQNGMPVFASVLTNFGQFGKTAYLSSIIKTSNANFEAPIVNVYRSDEPDSTTDIEGNFVLLPETPIPSSFTTHFTLAEFSNEDPSDDDSFIVAGAELIVNVPKGFTVVSATSDSEISPGNPVFTVTFDGLPADGVQVRAILNENIGDGVVGHKDARSISVTATAPLLDPPDKDRLAVFYVVASGSASYRTSSGSPLCPGNCAQWEIGPLSEVIVKVTKGP